MSGGTWVGPVGPLTAAGALRLPPLWAAVAVAVAMHAALLAVRPGGLTGSHVAPAAKAMAVRMLPPAATAEPVAASSERMPVTDATHTKVQVPPAVAAASERPPLPQPARTPRPGREAASERAGAVASQREPAPAAPAAPAAALPSTAVKALPAAPDYALGVRLDPGPRPLEDIEPDYPDQHLREGTVVLRVLISETGHVDNVAVVRAEPQGVFEQAALEAFGKARFAPGLAAGTPVKSQITVEVRFVPINRGARVSGRTY